MGYHYEYPHPTIIDGGQITVTGDLTFNVESIGCKDSLQKLSVLTVDSIEVNLAVNGLNGLDVGVIAPLTRYYVYAVRSSTIRTLPFAFIVSLSSTAPTLPENYDRFRKIGTIKIDSDTVIIPFFEKIDCFNIVNKPQTTNIGAYIVAGIGIIDIDIFDYTKIILCSGTGNVGTGTLNVRLYDVTNATEIVVVNFTELQDFTIKQSDISSYFEGKSGKFILEIQINKPVAGLSSEIYSAKIQVIKQ